MRVDGPDAPARAATSSVDAADEADREFDAVLADWLPLTYALNAINRRMGRSDLYPFVLPQPVIAQARLRRRAGASRRLAAAARAPG